MTKLTALAGINVPLYTKFESLGITNVNSLLNAGRTPEERRTLSRSAGISRGRLMGWLGCADLVRVFGISIDYAQMLSAIGVKDVHTLAQHDAEELQMVIKRVNRQKRLVRRVPSIDQLESWIEGARQLPPVLEV